MATIRLRNNRYQALVRTRNLSLSKTFSTKKLAISWAKATEVAIESGDYKKSKLITVEDALNIYKVKRIPNDRSSHAHIKNAILGLGSYLIDDLSTQLLVTYRNKRLKTHQPQTVKHELSMILRSLKWLRDEEGYEQISIPTIKMPEIPRGRERRLKDSELDILLHELQDTNEVASLVLIAVETGMRRSEILNIEWRDLNLLKKILHIPRAKNKTPRTIPLSSRVISIFSAFANRTSGRVFESKPSTVSHAFKRACTRAGLENLGFHDLRHEAISRFFEMGLNHMEVATISGHKDLRMLERYTHLRAEDLAKKLK